MLHDAAIFWVVLVATWWCVTWTWMIVEVWTNALSPQNRGKSRLPECVFTLVAILEIVLTAIAWRMVIT